MQRNIEFWLEMLIQASPAAAQLVDKYPSSPSSHFQVKWNVLGSLLSRSLRGTLRHLPSGESVRFSIPLPI